MSLPKTKHPELDHLDPDVLLEAAEKAKRRLEDEQRIVDRALDEAKADPAKAEAMDRLEALRESHRGLFASCERDREKAAYREGLREGMRRMLRATSGHEPGEDLLPAKLEADPRKAKRLHELALEIKEAELELGLVLPSEREQAGQLARALLSTAGKQGQSKPKKE